MQDNEKENAQNQQNTEEQQKKDEKKGMSLGKKVLIGAAVVGVAGTAAYFMCPKVKATVNGWFGKGESAAIPEIDGGLAPEVDVEQPVEGVGGTDIPTPNSQEPWQTRKPRPWRPRPVRM